MPLKPRPNAAETANRPASFWVSRKRPIASAWQAEPQQQRQQAADPVGQPAPELAADKGAAGHHRQHRRALRRRDADIAAKRDEVALRQRHRHAAAEPGEAQQRQHHDWAAGPAPCRARRRCAAAVGRRARLGRRVQETDRQRRDRDDADDAVADHRRLPAVARRSRARTRSARSCRRCIGPTRSAPARCRAAARTSG